MASLLFGIVLAVPTGESADWSLVCKVCGAAGSANIMPNWHDIKGGRCRSRGDGRDDAIPAFSG